MKCVCFFASLIFAFGLFYIAVYICTLQFACQKVAIFKDINIRLGMKQYYNILIYCNIYCSNTIQYGFKEISIYCTLQYIVIYCNILQYIAMFVVLML